MNERIRELAEQAAKEKFGGVFGEMKLTMTFAEKFAELIVRECANIADEYDGAGSTIVSRIKKHFEVEE